MIRVAAFLAALAAPSLLFSGEGTWTLETAATPVGPCEGPFSLAFTQAPTWELGIRGFARCGDGYLRSANYAHIPLEGTPETGFSYENPSWGISVETGPLSEGQAIPFRFVDFNEFCCLETFSGTFVLAESALPTP